MEFGLFSLLPQRDVATPIGEVYRDTIDMVRLAEAMDFDVAWLAEHHFGNYCMCPSPLLLASHIAAHTSRIRIGPAVLVLPLYHPLRVLEEIGMVDQLSDGRLVIGYGSGYQAFEFDRFGAPLDENWAMTSEIMDILEMGIETGHVEYRGKYFQIPPTPIGVPTLQRPSPPVIVAGNHPDYLRRAARKGYRPIITVGPQPVEAQLKVREHVSKHFQMEGIGDDDLPLAVSRAIFVTDDKREALEAAERTLYTARLVMAFRGRYEKLKGVEVQLQPFEGEPSLEEIAANLPIGDPETVAERIVNEIRANRPWHYAIFQQYGGFDGKRARRSLERFGAEVLPIIDRELGGYRNFGPKPRLMTAPA